MRQPALIGLLQTKFTDGCALSIAAGDKQRTGGDKEPNTKQRKYEIISWTLDGIHKK